MATEHTHTPTYHLRIECGLLCCKPEGQKGGRYALPHCNSPTARSGLDGVTNDTPQPTLTHVSDVDRTIYIRIALGLLLLHRAFPGTSFCLKVLSRCGAGDLILAVSTF